MTAAPSIPPVLNPGLADTKPLSRHEEERRAIAAMVAVLKAAGFPDSNPSGDFEARVGGSPFPRLNYATACALYECARRHGRDASLVDTYGLELIRRSWGQHHAKGCMP